MILILLTSFLIICFAYIMHNYLLADEGSLNSRHRRISSCPNLSRPMGNFFSDCFSFQKRRPVWGSRSKTNTASSPSRDFERHGSIVDQFENFHLDRRPRPSIKELRPSSKQSQLDQIGELCREVWNNGDPNERFIRAFDIEITRKDLLTLKHGKWLNDEVINFYLALIVERSNKIPSLPKTYAFNTFFYEAITKRGFAGVRRWTKNVNIFDHDLLIIPLHLSQVHWCLVVVDFEQKALKFFDSMYSEDGKYHLHKINVYLEEESQDKHGSAYSARDFRLFPQYNVPQQRNGCDCGVFTCQFAENYSRRARLDFTQEDIPSMREQMVYEIVNKRIL